MKINIELDSKDKERGLKILIGAIAVIAIIAVIITMMVVKGKKSKSDKDTDVTTETTSANSIDKKENATTKSSSTANVTSTLAVTDKSVNIQYVIEEKTSWEGNGKQFVQYTLSIKNNDTVDLKNWSLNLKVSNDCDKDGFWNCNLEKGDSVITITPVDYNKEIGAGKEIKDIGFTLAASKKGMIATDFLIIDYNGSEITINNAGNVLSGDVPASSTPENGKQEETKEQSENKPESQNNEEKKEDSPSPAPSSNNVNASGVLHVSGTKLVDGSGNTVQLRGVSTHGISWFPEYVNYDAFATLKNDWGANVVRIAMYPEEYNGYLSGGDKNALKQIIDNGVNYATQLGLYVIIDWHVLNYAPSRHTDEAKEFFTEMAKKYSDHTNVIYEICNEPVNADWNSDIKPYAESVISTIRSYDDHALILVGTNTWSQDVDAVIGNTLSDGNTMYVLHYYAATHKDNIRGKLTAALNAGVPIFVSESSICDASGNGGIDYDSANTWLQLLNSNDVSFICWSLCNKAETSALINSNCNKTSGWSDDDLSETGKWYKKAIKGN